jgi:hypothetical protein
MATIYMLFLTSESQVICPNLQLLITGLKNGRQYFSLKYESQVNKPKPVEAASIPALKPLSPNRFPWLT